jgi:hypothetical protein
MRNNFLHKITLNLFWIFVIFKYIFLGFTKRISNLTKLKRNGRNSC